MLELSMCQKIHYISKSILISKCMCFYRKCSAHFIGILIKHKNTRIDRLP